MRPREVALSWTRRLDRSLDVSMAPGALGGLDGEGLEAAAVTSGCDGAGRLGVGAAVGTSVGLGVGATEGVALGLADRKSVV